MPAVEFALYLPSLSPSTEKVTTQSVQGAFVQMRPQTVSIAIVYCSYTVISKPTLSHTS